MTPTLVGRSTISQTRAAVTFMLWTSPFSESSPMSSSSTRVNNSPGQRAATVDESMPLSTTSKAYMRRWDVSNPGSAAHASSAAGRKPARVSDDELTGGSSESRGLPANLA